MIPFYLILAHLTADFLLQPNRLVRFKERSFLGVLIHGGIHVLISLFFLLPYLSHGTVWIAVLSIGITHVFIDQGKISLQLRTDKYLHPFLLDQIFHFFVIYAVITFFNLQQMPKIFFQPAWISDMYNNSKFPLLLVILVFATAVYDITMLQMSREKKKNAAYHFNDKNFILRITVAGLVFLSFVMLGYAG